MDYGSDDDDGQWAEVFEGDYNNMTPPAQTRPSQHKEALIGALRELAQGTRTERRATSGEDNLPLIIIDDKESLQRYRENEAQARRFMHVREQECANDFLASMFFPLPQGMFYRYSQLNHILKLILFANDQIPRVSNIDDGARLSEKDIVDLSIMCLPDWWKEIGAVGPRWWLELSNAFPNLHDSLPRAWDAFCASGPEMQQLTIPFPCPFKKFTEEGLILWGVCFVTPVRDWYFGKDPGGKPSVMDMAMQEQFLFRGNIPGAQVPMATMLDAAVCNGMDKTLGFMGPVMHIHQHYYEIIDVSPPPMPPPPQQITGAPVYERRALPM